MIEEVKNVIRRKLLEQNPGLLPDEADREVEAVMYRKELYSEAVMVVAMRHYD